MANAALIAGVVVGLLLLCSPWLAGLLKKKTPDDPQPDLVATPIDDRLRMLGYSLRIRDSLSDNAECVKALDTLITPALMVRKPTP